MDASTAAAVAGQATAAPQVVLTREKGKNGKLQKVLEARGISCLEMPLIETTAGPDRCAGPRRGEPQGVARWRPANTKSTLAPPMPSKFSCSTSLNPIHLGAPTPPCLRPPPRLALPEVLCSRQFDWVCLTSPESASVFLEAWRVARCPQVRVAVVGEGTGEVLTEAVGDALRPEFVPTAVRRGARAGGGSCVYSL